MNQTELRLERAEYLIKHLLEAVQQHGQYLHNIEKRNSYAGGFNQGLISDELEFIDLDVFGEIVNEESQDQEQEAGEEV